MPDRSHDQEEKMCVCQNLGIVLANNRLRPCPHCGQGEAQLLKLLRQAQVPAGYLHMSLANFRCEDEADRQAMTAARRCVDELPKRGLRLISESHGVGKTHLAVGILREAIRLGYRGRFYSMPDLFNRMLAAIENGNGHLTALKEQLRQAEIIVLDDLGAERRTTEWAQRVYYDLLEGMSQNGQVLIVTSNQDVRNLSTWLDQRALSRLIALTGQAVRLTGTDHRIGRKS